MDAFDSVVENVPILNNLAKVLPEAFGSIIDALVEGDIVAMILEAAGEIF